MKKEILIKASLMLVFMGLTSCAGLPSTLCDNPYYCETPHGDPSPDPAPAPSPGTPTNAECE